MILVLCRSCKKIDRIHKTKPLRCKHCRSERLKPPSPNQRSQWWAQRHAKIEQRKTSRALRKEPPSPPG